MITIFGDFCQFSVKKLLVSNKKQGWVFIEVPSVISPRGQKTKSARFYSSLYEANSHHQIASETKAGF
jgi:hypothetical protein